MEHLLQVRPQRVWRMYKRRRFIVLMDYDGTLTPIALTPAQARLPKRTRVLLGRLSQSPGVHVGVISGRSLADVKRLVGLPRVIYVGNHGLEVEGPGLSFLHPQARRLRHTLHRVSRKLAQALRQMPAVLVEWKGLTVSLHWRNIPRSAQRRFHRLVKELTAPDTERGTIRLTNGKRVVEIRPQVDWDKGRVVQWLLDHLLGRHRSSPAGVFYVGDDRTDEDAFKVVNHLGGLSVFVGHQGKRTTARYRLRDSREVQRWLADLCHIRTRLNATEGGS